MGLFSNRDPKEKMREMISTLRREKYKIQRDVAALQRENKKVELNIKKRAKDGKIDEAKILARELVHSRKAVTRLFSAGANIDCIISELHTQEATVKLAGTMKTSADIMRSMAALIKVGWRTWLIALNG